MLEATRDLLNEVGYEKLTMDGIAARSGVSKMTMYRWWTSKSAIVADAVLSGTIGVDPLSFPDTGNLRADLGAWLELVIGMPIRPEAEALALGMAAAATADTRAGAEFYARFTGRNREALLGRLRSAAAAGEIDANIAFEPVVDALFGLLLFRLVTRASADLEYAAGLSEFLLAGLGMHRSS